MPIAIAGMHRSGTSLIAHLLGLCGLDLGPESALIPPAPDNTEGFWESRPFVHVNQEILTELGGLWDRPPQPLPGWERHPQFDRWRSEARELPALLGLKEPWGWKDPRNCHTLPFWRDLWPDLRVVVCVRNPLEVANSLLQRNGIGFGSSLKLWHAYHKRVLESIEPRSMIVTHYEAFFADPVTELARLVGFAQLPSDQKTMAAACAAVIGEMRHSRSCVDEMAEIGAPTAIRELYIRLIRDGGPVIARCAADGCSRSQSFVNAVRLAIRLEEADDARQLRIRELECRLQLCEEQRDQYRAGSNHYKDLAGQRGDRIRILEERLHARRHRYAERVAGLLFKSTES